MGNSPTLVSSAPARVTITAPTAIGDDFLFTVIFSRTPLDGITGSTAVTAQIDVVGNTPPAIHVPGARSPWRETPRAAGPPTST